MKHHKKKSKRQKLSTKYNLQKKVREHRRRLRKEAKKLGLDKKGKTKKDPGIPNNWPFKAEMLQALEKKKEKKEKEIMEKRLKVKEDTLKERQEREEERKRLLKEREELRREQRMEEQARLMKETFRKNLGQADVILEVLDARDPLGCRCAGLEAWAAKEGKRLIFVLTKVDLVPGPAAGAWLGFLGHVAPTAAVQCEPQRDGVAGLLKMLGRLPSAEPAKPLGEAVCVVGYPGVGKKCLLRAMRREVKLPGAKWLLETPLRLPSPQGSLRGAEALHLALRDALPSGAGAGEALKDPQPEEAVKALLARAAPAAVIRRFRLAAYDSAEAFFATFAKDREVTSRKGKAPTTDAIARHVLKELAEAPASYCTPPTSPLEGQADLWGAFGGARAPLAAASKERAAALSGAAAVGGSALAVASSGLGPAVDMDKMLAADEELSDAESEDADMGGSDEEDGLLEGEEGGEEEDALEDSEEEDMEDDE